MVDDIAKDDQSSQCRKLSMNVIEELLGRNFFDLAIVMLGDVSTNDLNDVV